MDLSPGLTVLARVERTLATLKARGLAAEYFVRGGAGLSLIFEPSTGHVVESFGEALRATCRIFQGTHSGMATSDVAREVDFLRLADEATARRVPTGLSRPEGHPPARLGVVPNAALSGERALRLARAMVAPLSGRPGCFQAVTVRQALAFTVVASTEGTRALEFHPFERGLLRYELPLGAWVDGVAGPLGDETLDPSPVAARFRAAWEAIEGDGLAPAPELPWTLRPHCAAPLVAGLSWLLRGDVAAKTPGLLRALGKKVFPQALTLVDDTAGRHLDDEGVPALPLRPLEAGRIVHFLHSSATARMLGVDSNGRGLRLADEGDAVPSALAPRLLPGAGPLPLDRNDFEARLDTFSLMARPARVLLRLAGWVVRGGERIHRIAPLEREVSVLDTFRALLTVGSDLAVFPAIEGCGSPTLTFASLVEPPAVR